MKLFIALLFPVIAFSQSFYGGKVTTGNKKKAVAVQCSSFDNDNNCEEFDILIKNDLAGYHSLEVVNTIKEINYRKASKKGQKIKDSNNKNSNKDLYKIGTVATTQGCGTSPIVCVTVPLGVAFDVVKAPILIPYLGVSSMIKKAKTKKEFKKILKFVFEKENQEKILEVESTYIDALTELAKKL